MKPYVDEKVKVPEVVALVEDMARQAIGYPLGGEFIPRCVGRELRAGRAGLAKALLERGYGLQPLPKSQAEFDAYQGLREFLKDLVRLDRLAAGWVQ